MGFHGKIEGNPREMCGDLLKSLDSPGRWFVLLFHWEIPVIEDFFLGREGEQPQAKPSYPFGKEMTSASIGEKVDTTGWRFSLKITRNGIAKF